MRIPFTRIVSCVCMCSSAFIRSYFSLHLLLYPFNIALWSIWSVIYIPFAIWRCNVFGKFTEARKIGNIMYFVCAMSIAIRLHFDAMLTLARATSHPISCFPFIQNGLRRLNIFECIFTISLIVFVLISPPLPLCSF